MRYYAIRDQYFNGISIEVGDEIHNVKPHPLSLGGVYIGRYLGEELLLYADDFVATHPCVAVFYENDEVVARHYINPITMAFDHDKTFSYDKVLISTISGEPIGGFENYPTIDFVVSDGYFDFAEELEERHNDKIL